MPDRPTGVKVLGISTIIAAIFNIFSVVIEQPSWAIVSAFNPVANLILPNSLTLLLIMGAGGLLLFVAVGLLSMRRWGYYTAVVFSTLLVLDSLFSAFVSTWGFVFIMFDIGTILGLVLGITTIFYLNHYESYYYPPWREEQVPGVEARTRYAGTTPRSPTRHESAAALGRDEEEAPEQERVLEVRRAMPRYETRPIIFSKHVRLPGTRVGVGDLEARREALRDLMEEVNSRFDSGRLTHEEYVEIYTKYSAKLASIDKKLGRLDSCTPALGKGCCLFCGSEISGDAKHCPNCGGVRLKCPVCQMDITSGEPLVKCPYCGALSHREHLLEWIKVKGYCPKCNQKLREKDIT